MLESSSFPHPPANVGLGDGAAIDCAFENVTFEEGPRLSGTTAMDGCTVNSNAASQYALWLDTGSFTITYSKFYVGESGYGMAKSDAAIQLTLKGNTFSYLSVPGKEALNTDEATITVEDNEFVDCLAGILPSDKANTVNGGEGITGGSYLNDPTDYVKYPYCAQEKDGVWTVSHSYVPSTPLPDDECADDAACNVFTDVDADAWYHEYVDWAHAEGILRGHDDGSNCLGPQDDAERGHFAAMLMRLDAKYSIL